MARAKKMGNRLKVCYLCGDKSVLYEISKCTHRKSCIAKKMYTVECQRCLARTELYGSELDAVKVWNEKRRRRCS